MRDAMNAASSYLLQIARRVAFGHADIPGACASMVTGSVADGTSDFYSDVDMTVYYDDLPPDEILQAARAAIGGSDRVWFVDDRENGGVMEAYTIDGIECQIGHISVAAWERDIASVLEGLDVTSPLQKALSGTLTCIPLFGESWIEKWKSIARNYPDALAQAMVERHLQFFPVWGLQGRLATRDATLWMQQSLVETSHNILAILAGLNRVYFSTFQFKRMHAFIAGLKVAPDNLAARIEALFNVAPSVAAPALEALVRETLALVNAQMPQVDTSKASRRVGWRQQPWERVGRDD